MSVEVENYKSFINIEEDLKFLTKSKIRLKILNCLNQAPHTIKEIVKITNLTYSSVSSNINKLEKNNNIYKENNKFKLNYLTKIHLKNLLDFNQSLEIINNYEEFWNKHNIGDLDYNSIKNITELYNSELVKSTDVDIYKTHNTIIEDFIKSKKIKAIFPYLHPDYPKIIESKLKENCEIELIINNNIYKNLILNINDNIRKEMSKKGNLIVHSTKEPLNIYLTICDKQMSLGLFKNDKSFDQNRILTSSNKKSLEWSKNLFEVIKNRVN